MNAEYVWHTLLFIRHVSLFYFCWLPFYFTWMKKLYGIPMVICGVNHLCPILILIEADLPTHIRPHRRIFENVWTFWKIITNIQNKDCRLKVVKVEVKKGWGRMSSLPVLKRSLTLTSPPYPPALLRSPSNCTSTRVPPPSPHTHNFSLWEKGWKINTALNWFSF